MPAKKPTKTKLNRLKKKPTRPNQDIDWIEVCIDLEGKTLGEILPLVKTWMGDNLADFSKKWVWNPEDITLDDLAFFTERDWDSDYSYKTVLSLRVHEHDVHYNKRLAEFEKRLAAYHQWYEDNQEAIKEYQEGKRAKEKVKADKERNRLQKEIDRMNKKLKELGDEDE